MESLHLFWGQRWEWKWGLCTECMCTCDPKCLEDWKHLLQQWLEPARSYLSLNGAAVCVEFIERKFDLQHFSLLTQHFCFIYILSFLILLPNIHLKQQPRALNPSELYLTTDLVLELEALYALFKFMPCAMYNQDRLYMYNVWFYAQWLILK